MALDSPTQWTRVWWTGTWPPRRPSPEDVETWTGKWPGLDSWLVLQNRPLEEEGGTGTGGRRPPGDDPHSRYSFLPLTKAQRSTPCGSRLSGLNQTRAPLGYLCTPGCPWRCGWCYLHTPSCPWRRGWCHLYTPGWPRWCRLWIPVHPRWCGWRTPLHPWMPVVIRLAGTCASLAAPCPAAGWNAGSGSWRGDAMNTPPLTLY